MYFVHQIIVRILYAILCIVFGNRRHMDEEGVHTRYCMLRQHINHSGDLSPALYHDDVITKISLDKR